MYFLEGWVFNDDDDDYDDGDFYPRPVLAFGYCRCLRLSVCVSVCVCVRQPRACPRHKSPRVQARTTKFGQKVQNNLVKVPVVLGGDWPWPSRSNLTWKAKFTTFWACPCHNSPSIQARTTKFGQRMQTNLLVAHIVFGGDCTSLHDGFTVPWIHHGTENCIYFMHTRLCLHTLNCNRFNHIESPIFSLIHSGAIYIRVAHIADACAIR